MNRVLKKMVHVVLAASIGLGSAQTVLGQSASGHALGAGAPSEKAILIAPDSARARSTTEPMRLDRTPDPAGSESAKSPSRVQLAQATRRSIVPGATAPKQPSAGSGQVSGPGAGAPAVISDEPALLAKPIAATIGKSILLRFDEPVERVSVGNPNVVDVTLITRRELYLLGKALGGTNVMLWGKSGRTTVVDITVELDTAPLAAQLRKILPNETDIRVDGAAGSVMLVGSVSSALAADQAVSVAEAYVRDLNRALVLPVVAGDSSVASGTQVRVGTTTGGAVGATVASAGARVVNLLRVREGQQVMLEVKVAEVNRTLLEKLGFDLQLGSSNGAIFGIASQFADAALGGFLGWANAGNLIQMYAQRNDGLVKLLAEPNIVAISGQEGSFLAGGTVFLPVPQSGAGGGPATITLQERDFGVSVKFLPTVLANGRINLRVQPEVSEPLQQGLSVGAGGATQVLPAFASRRASTTVQLNDGQSLAIAGLIRNNWTQAVEAYPVLGELPILGTLFRSTDWRNDKTELLFVITPRLVKPLPPQYALPTDNHTEPSRVDAFVGGQMEGKTGASAEDRRAPASSQSGVAESDRPGGFEMRRETAPTQGSPGPQTSTSPPDGANQPDGSGVATRGEPVQGVSAPQAADPPGS